MVIEILALSIGLAMDAFSVSICKGLKNKNISISQCLYVGFMFGLFQALMPVIGYLLGYSLYEYIESVDHWIAFALLAYIGGKMMYEAIKKKEEEDNGSLAFKEVFILSIATSIDALAAGISIATSGNSHVVLTIISIGVITFILSTFGAFFGKKLGKLLGNKTEIVGGVILI